MRGQRPFEGAKKEKIPDSNLMIYPAGVDGRAGFMWNISRTSGSCQGRLRDHVLQEALLWLCTHGVMD